MADLHARTPQSLEYAQYADSHWRELIDRYQPSVMWNDISYPKAGKIPELFAQYYNTVPEGVINNRFGVSFSDYTTPEYAKYDKIMEKKWEECRGLGFSFGYNQAEGPEQVIAPDKLIALLIDIVSRNGNLLLNVGPKADRSISISNSTVCISSARGFESTAKVSSTPALGPGRFHQRGIGSAVHSQKRRAVRVSAGSSLPGSDVTLPGIRAASGTTVRTPGGAADISWKQAGDNLVVSMPQTERGPYAAAVRITPLPSAV